MSLSGREFEASATARVVGPPHDPRVWWWAGTLALLVFGAFLPALRAEFLNWDDPGNFLRNMGYRGLGWEHLRWMATTFHMGVYQPLGWFCLGLQYVLFQLNATGYHVVSVLFHVAGVVVFFFVVRRLLACAPGPGATASGFGLAGSAWVAALLFGVHPLRVEAVVWLSCQPYVICAFFYLLGILFYLRGQTADEKSPGARGFPVAALLCSGLALLSKAPAVSLPAVLVVLDVYPLRRLGGALGWWGPAARRVWLEKLPFFLLALPIAIIAPLCKQEVMLPMAHHGWAARLAHSAFGMGFYLQKTLFPTTLLPFYEMPYPLDPTAPKFLAAQGFVVVVTVALLAWRRRYPYLLAAWTAYVLILLPNLGVVQYGQQITADRYSHLAGLGGAVLVGAGLWRIWRRVRRPIPQVCVAAGLAMCSVLGLLTWRHVQRWRNSEALWTYTVAHAPHSWLVHQCLGTAQLDLGDYEEALAQFHEVLRLKPDDVEAHYNLGLALRRQGRIEAAIGEFARAIELKPDYAEALYNLGNVLCERRELLPAIEAYLRAAEANPADRDIRHNLGVALYTLGRGAENVARFLEVVRLAPEWVQRGIARFARGCFQEAAAAFREVVRIDPHWIEGYLKLATALDAQGRPTEAVTVLRRALELDPPHPAIRKALEILLGQRDRFTPNAP